MAAGYEPVPISAIAGIDGLARAAFRRGEPNTDSLLSFMEVGIVGLPTFQHTFDPGLVPLSPRELSGGRAQYQEVGVGPAPFRLVHRILHIEGKMRVSAMMSSPGFDPRQEAIVTGNGAADLDLSLRSGMISRSFPATVDLLGLSETEARILVDVGPYSAYLVYASTAYPGWMGRIDGKSVSPLRTDGAYLGLPIPPGKHVVTFEYRPNVCRLGAFLSLVAAGLCVAATVHMGLIRIRIGRSRGRVGPTKIAADVEI